MKKILFITTMCLFIVACSKSDNGNNNNQFLPNVVFDTGGLINTNLPQFNSLQFPGNHILLSNNYGLNGVVVYYSGSSYNAFELSDPNHALEGCSILTINGVIATCGCLDAKQYDILTGQPQQGTTGQYGLKRYFVEVNGNIIRVYNN